METPRKADVRKFGQASGDLSLSDTVNARKQDVTKYEGETQMYAGFTDALMGRYANKLEADGKKQALIDAYDQSRKGEKMKPEEVGSFTSVYHKAYEEMSVKIYQNDLKIEADAIVNQYALQFKDDPAGFKNQMDLYVQKTEGEIPEYLRESWHQELQGLTAVHSRKIMENDLRNTREAYAASFVNSSRLLETQALNAADARNAKLLDTYITDYERSIDEAVTNEIMTPAQGEKLKIGFKAGVGEEFIMSHFGTFLDAGIDEAIAIQRQFAAAPTMGDRSGGSRSWRNRNPGNHKYGKFAKSQGAIGQDKGGFAIYPSEAAGRAAQANLLRGKSYADKNLTQMVDRYAPSSDNNNTVAYVNRLMQDTGIDPQKKMGDYSAAEMEALTFAMQKHEGWTPGETNVPWEYNTEERDAIAAKMATMIKKKQTDLKAGKTALKSKNNFDLGEATKIYEDGSEPRDKTNLDVLTDEEASYAKVANYKIAQQLQPYIQAFNTLPILQQVDEINKLSAKEERNISEQRLLDGYEKAFNKNETLINIDPVTAVVKNVSSESFKPLTGDTIADLRGRVKVAQSVESSFGIPKVYYTKLEAGEFSKRFTGVNGEYNNMVQYAGNVVEALGNDAKYVFNQLGDENAHTMSMVGQLFTNTHNNPMGVELASKISEGIDYVQGKNKIPGIIPRDFQSNFYGSANGVLATMGADNAMAYNKGVQALVAARIVDNNEIQEAQDGTLDISGYVEEALTDIMGGEPLEIGGQTLMPPWKDADADDFENQLLIAPASGSLDSLSEGMKEAVTAEMLKPTSVGWFTSNDKASKLKYRSLGNGEYNITLSNGKIVPDKDGKPFVLRMSR